MKSLDSNQEEHMPGELINKGLDIVERSQVHLVRLDLSPSGSGRLNLGRVLLSENDNQL